MICRIKAGSGTPPASAAASSRKYSGPSTPGVSTLRNVASASLALWKLCTAPRRTNRADELAEQPVGERQRHADAGRLDPAPARGQMPEQQHQPHLEPRLAGDRAQRVDVGDAPTGAAQQRLDDLRPGPHALGEFRVQQREACRPAARATPPRARAARRLARWAAGADRRSPSSSVAVRSPTRVSNAIRPSRISSPGPCPSGVEPGPEVALADLGVEHPARWRAGARRCACGRRTPARGRRRRRAGRCAEGVDSGCWLASCGRRGQRSGPGRTRLVFVRIWRSLSLVPRTNRTSRPSVRLWSAAAQAGNHGYQQRRKRRYRASHRHLEPVVEPLRVPGDPWASDRDRRRGEPAGQGRCRRRAAQRQHRPARRRRWRCGPGDWVLIHVGFAISQVDEEEARATRDLLVRMGADYEQELEELKASVIE